jgi:hypothetical protein
MKAEISVESMIAGAGGLTGGKPIVAAAPVVAAAPAATAAPAAVVEPTPGPAIKPIIVRTPLGDQVYGGVPVSSVKLSSFADVQAFAKDFAGVDIKDVQDFVPILTELKIAKEQADINAQLHKTVGDLTSTLDNLPKDVSLILTTAIQGGDYASVINNFQKRAVLNFDEPFNSQDPVKLVNHYTGKQYTKEAFDALEVTTKDALTDSVKLKFEAERNELLNFETNTKKATEEKQTKFRASVDASIAAWLTSNPHVGKAEVDRVRNRMLYGLTDVLFTNEKTYKPEAAEKVAMMEYGKATIAAQAETIGDIVKQISNKSDSQAVERILLKSDKPPVAGGGRDNNLIAAEVAKATSWLKPKQ